MESPEVVRITLPEEPREPRPAGGNISRHIGQHTGIFVFLAGFLMPIVLWMPLSFIAYARGTFDTGTLIGMFFYVTLMACANSVPYLLFALMLDGREFFCVLPRKSFQIVYAVPAIGLSIAANVVYLIWPEPVWAGVYFIVPLAGAAMWACAYAIERWLGKRGNTRSLVAGLLIMLIAFVQLCDDNAYAKLPESPLSYAALYESASSGYGSGFFLHTTRYSYFVTAKHVLEGQDINTGKSRIRLYSLNDDENLLILDNSILNSSGAIILHSSHDVAVIVIGRRDEVDSSAIKLTTIKGVQFVEPFKGSLVGFGVDVVKKYDEVVVSNDVFVFGYPISLALRSDIKGPDDAQFDIFKPLLRKGIVAGKDNRTKAIILDCPVYFGNSGGPVMEVAQEGLSYHYRVVGVVSQYVPFEDRLYNERRQMMTRFLSNSGYSVAIPMDYVLELIQEYENK